jgi:ATP-dependent DNA ligase
VIRTSKPPEGRVFLRGGCINALTFRPKTPSSCRPSYAFDIMVMNGDDLRELSLFEPKRKLGEPARKHHRGAVRTGRDRPRLLRPPDEWAGGLVSKHRERRYRPRTCDWIKLKEPR